MKQPETTVDEDADVTIHNEVSTFNTLTPDMETFNPKIYTKEYRLTMLTDPMQLRVVFIFSQFSRARVEIDKKTNLTISVYARLLNTLECLFRGKVIH